MKKTVWITVLQKDQDMQMAQKLHQAVSQYGLDPQGHFWQDDLAQMGWAAPLKELQKKEVAVWIVLGKAEEFESESIRYGLACLAMGVQAQRGHAFPILIVLTGGQLQADSLPTPLGSADILSIDSASLGPKITAKANLPVKNLPTDYRLDIYALAGIGQWFEVGPAQGQTWQGALFGTSEGEITAHGVGQAGRLPEKAVLEYPMQGLELRMGDTKYTAWAVKNQLADDGSYFVGLKGHPESILFGPLPEDDDTEAFVVKLK